MGRLGVSASLSSGSHVFSNHYGHARYGLRQSEKNEDICTYSHPVDTAGIEKVVGIAKIFRTEAFPQIGSGQYCQIYNAHDSGRSML